MIIIGCDFHTRYQQIAMMEQASQAPSIIGSPTNSRDVSPTRADYFPRFEDWSIANSNAKIAMY
jgi:hypothetical protein